MVLSPSPFRTEDCGLGTRASNPIKKGVQRPLNTLLTPHFLLFTSHFLLPTPTNANNRSRPAVISADLAYHVPTMP